jgi:transposase
LNIAKKKRKSRTGNLNHLKTEVTEYTLSEEEKVCPNCKTKLVQSFEDTRETIKLYKRVIRHLEKRAIYSCPKCNYMIKAPIPKLPIEGSLASSSALSQVIVDKFANGIPLYRQSQDFDRVGLSLSRQTLSNWIIKSSLLLDIVYQAMVKTLLTKDILHADETTL